jgi:hypothetical protein
MLWPEGDGLFIQVKEVTGTSSNGRIDEEQKNGRPPWQKTDGKVNFRFFNK